MYRLFHVFILANNDSSLRWTTLHPEHWTTSEVMGWVQAVTHANQIRGYDADAIHRAFETVSGQQLITMRKDDFVALLGHRGDFMYSSFRTIFSVPHLEEDRTRNLTPISEKTDSDSSPEPGSTTGEVQYGASSTDCSSDVSVNTAGTQTGSQVSQEVKDGSEVSEVTKNT